MTKTKILVVEDELITATHITSVLEEKGYEVPEPIIKGEEVPEIVAKEKPDAIIMDINLAGKLDGVETARIISGTTDIPIIFLTSNSDEQTFEESKTALPHAFLTKPFKSEELLRTIDVVINRHQSHSPQESSSVSITEDKSIFVTSKNKKVKIHIENIKYVVADRNYCTVVTTSKEYVLSMSLGVFEKKIPSESFTRIHRSYLINLEAVDSLDDHHVFIGQKSIPIGNSYKKMLQSKIRIV